MSKTYSSQAGDVSDVANPLSPFRAHCMSVRRVPPDRYYGKSIPSRKNQTDRIEFLTIEQAMADYAELILELKDTLNDAKDSPVIGFGGSYGTFSSLPSPSHSCTTTSLPACAPSCSAVLK